MLSMLAIKPTPAFAEIVKKFVTVLITSFSLTSLASALPLTDTRGLEGTGLDRVSMAVSTANRAAVVESLKETPLYSKAKSLSRKRISDRQFYLKLAQVAFREFNAQRAQLDINTTAPARRQLVLLQYLLEEFVMRADRDHSGKTEHIFQVEKSADSNSKIRGVSVAAGDIIVQLGAKYLSSHFIAQSQSQPGMASHALLVRQGGPQAEILEALIEDGVNTRGPSKSQMARFWVVSAPNQDQRQNVALALEDFIQRHNIPKVEGDGFGTSSPLRYDSQMNFSRRDQGYYFCTGLVQTIYEDARISTLDDLTPYPLSQANWNPVSGIEAEVYKSLGISVSRIPAPSDVLFQPNLSIQALYVDSAGLRNSRRLRATIDAFYDILENDHQKFGDLIEAFKGIGDMEIDKTKIVERLKRWVDSIDQPDLKAKLESLTKSVEQSLPQTANLRQIVFFMTLNQLVQDQALEHLTNFEEQRLRRHATPGELREEAYQLLTKQLQQVTALIRTLP